MRAAVCLPSGFPGATCTKLGRMTALTATRCLCAPLLGKASRYCSLPLPNSKRVITNATHATAVTPGTSSTRRPWRASSLRPRWSSAMQVGQGVECGTRCAVRREAGCGMWGEGRVRARQVFRRSPPPAWAVARQAEARGRGRALLEQGSERGVCVSASSRT